MHPLAESASSDAGTPAPSGGGVAGAEARGMRLVLGAALDILPLALLFYIFVPAAVYPSLFHHAGTNREVCAATQLCTSWSTPWGIITSNFLFDGLSKNLIPMAYCFVFAVISIFSLPQTVRRRVSVGVALTAFLSGVLANLAWLIAAEIEYIRSGVGSPPTSYGYSAVGYGLVGATTMLVILVFHRNAKTWRGGRRDIRVLGYLMLSGFCLFAVTIAVPVLLWSAHSLNTQQQHVNYLVHYVSFSLSSIAFLIPAFRRWILGEPMVR